MTPGERAVWAAAYGAAWVARYDAYATMWDDKSIADAARNAANRAVKSLRILADDSEIAEEIIG